MMRKNLFLLGILFSLLSPSVFAQGIVCDEGFDMFDPIRKMAHPWPKFREYFLKYAAGCNEGYFADGASELTNDLLIKWKDIAGLVDLSKKDPKFRAYVISNVNNTETKKRLAHVKKNAQTRCPKWAKDLCDDIIKAADEGMKGD